MNRQTRIFKSIPKYFKPGVNKNITALLTAIANENTAIDTQLQNARDQLFLPTASNQFLDLLASNTGVTRPSIIAFSDENFRKFIPLASYGPKQIKESIYKCLEIFWGASYLHSTLVSTNAETYNLVGGEILEITIDDTHDVTIQFLESDFETPGSATAEEIIARINTYYSTHLTASVDSDNLGGNKYVALATNTFGLAGSIEVTGGTANDILGFSTVKKQYTKVSLHEINPNELVVRIPKNITITNDSLLWSHHFHSDATIYDGEPETTSATPYWPGSFLYGASSRGSVSIYSTNAILETNITAGLNYSILTFDDVSDFPSGGGRITFDFGNSSQEASIRYFSRISNTQLRIDAAHIFEYSHTAGIVVNLTNVGTVIPDIDGSDYPIFFVDTGIGEQMAGIGLLLLKAAGVIVRFIFTDDE